MAPAPVVLTGTIVDFVDDNREVAWCVLKHRVTLDLRYEAWAITHCSILHSTAETQRVLRLVHAMQDAIGAAPTAVFTLLLSSLKPSQQRCSVGIRGARGGVLILLQVGNRGRHPTKHVIHTERHHVAPEGRVKATKAAGR